MQLKERIEGGRRKKKREVDGECMSGVNVCLERSLRISGKDGCWTIQYLPMLSLIYKYLVLLFGLCN